MFQEGSQRLHFTSFYQRLGKHLNIRHLHLLYRVNVLKDIKNALGKCPCWSPALVTLLYDFIKTRH